MKLVSAISTHVHGVPTAPSPPSTSVFMHAVALVATAVAVAAALGPLCGIAPRKAARPWLAAAVAPAALAGLLTFEPDRISALLAVVLAVATLALPALSARRPAGPIVATLVWLLVAVQATSGERGADRMTGFLYALGATLGVAVATVVVAGETGRQPALPRRLLPWAAGAAVVAGVLRGWINGVRPDGTAWWSSFGQVTVVEVILLVSAMALGLGVVAPDWATRGLARAATVLAGVLVVGALAADAVLASVPAPPAPPIPGVPMLRSLALGAYRLPVFIVPERPGWNLVHLGADSGSAGLDRAHLTQARVRSAATGSWASVWLPAGRSRLWVGYRRAVGSLSVDTGRSAANDRQFTGADGPECASAALGAVLAGSRLPLASCPAQELTSQDAQALRAMVGFVAQRGASTISVVGDGSPRGLLALALLRAAAADYHLTISATGWHPLFVVAGWEGAQATLQEVGSSRIRSEGVYLAPWLLTAPVLTNYASPVIALRFDPSTPAPTRYLTKLSLRFPGESPSSGGYASWRSGNGPTDPPRLFATSLAFVPGEPIGHDHGPAWLPSGTVVAVTGALTG